MIGGRRYRREKVGMCMISTRRSRPSLSTAWAIVIVAGGGGGCFPQLSKSDFLTPTCLVIPPDKHTQRFPISIES